MKKNNHKKPSRLLLLSTIATLFTGCIYPVYRTIQPKMRVEVVDSKGIALNRAKVFLSTQEYYPHKFKVEIVRSDEKGIARFDSIKKWGIDMLVMHGIKPENSWTLCIEKERYKTKIIHLNSEDDFTHQKVILTASETTDCLDKLDMGR